MGTTSMCCRYPLVIITNKTTKAGCGSLIAVMVATALVGAPFAGGILSRADVNARPKPSSRLAFNASGLRPSSEASILPAQSTLAEIKEIAALRLAAEEGSARAQLDLGLRYASGSGVSKDAIQAIKWFRRAAEQGFDEAQYTLGCCYNGEEGFPKNSREAVKWWEKAAAQGYADAQYCLGLSYAMGEGVAKDPTEAVNWWKKAAEQENADAQYFLGLSYSAGLGVPKIQELAIEWLRKAATHGNENAVTALKKIKIDSDSAPSTRKRSADRFPHGKTDRPA